MKELMALEEEGEEEDGKEAGVGGGDPGICISVPYRSLTPSNR